MRIEAMAEKPMTEIGGAGRMDGKIHHLPVRVYYAETDAGGVVHHASYFLFAERARTEMLRLIGCDLGRMRAEGLLFLAVKSCTSDFLRTGRLDDLLDVRTFLTSVNGASVDLVQTIWRGDEELVRLQIRLVSVGDTGRALRLPAVLRADLQQLVMKVGD